MKKVCEAVTKAQGINTEQESVVQASAPELGQLLFYLMVSGFFLREAEVHLDLQRKIGGESNLKNLLEWIGRPVHGKARIQGRTRFKVKPPA